MLELVPTKPEAAVFLKQHLPLWLVEYPDGTNNIKEPSATDKKSKVKLLEDAPFSTGEFEKAWTEICAFENEEAAWKPSAALLLQGWNIIMTTSTIKGYKLYEEFPIASITNTADEDGFPLALIEAIVARISTGDRNLGDGFARLDCHKTVFWVGSRFLESLEGEVSMTRFVEQWQGKLPEEWRGEAILEMLKVSVDQIPSEQQLTACQGFISSQYQSKYHIQ